MRPATARRSLVALVLLVAACTPGGSAPGPPEEPPGPGDTSQTDADPPDDEVATEEPVEPTPPPGEPTEPDAAGPERWQATWVHLFDDTLKSAASLDTLVDELVTADVDVVFAQVARRHDAYYRSEVLPPTPDPELEPGLDVLEALLARTRPAGIEVHAWVGLAPTWHGVYEGLPPPSGWVAIEHGRVAPEADRWVSRTIDGDWSEYLDPALPEVRAHYVDVVGELVDRYDVDGVHLDYVRYDSARHGYHPRVVAAYQEESGTSAVPAPDDPAWSAWRRQQVDRVVAAVADRVGDRTLTAAVIAQGAGPGELGGFERTRAYREMSQDWPGWVEAGLVDAVVPMNYFRSAVPEHDGWFDDWLTFGRHLQDRGGGEVRVVGGVGGWLNGPEATRDQLRRAVEATGGAALYSFQQPVEDAGARTALLEQLGAGWGPAPGPEPDG